MQTDYTRDYIRRARSDDTIEPPDAKKTTMLEVLEVLYESHREGGAHAARLIYDQRIQPTRPDVAALFAPDDPQTVTPAPPSSTSDDEGEWKPDDDAIASTLANEVWRDKYAFFYHEWRVYEDGFWQYRQEAEIKQEVRRFLRNYRQYGIQVSNSRVKAVTAMIQDDMFVPDRDIMNQSKERKRYIPLANGLFNIETMSLEDHRPELYFTNQLNFEFDPVATCPNWLRFLNTSLVIPGTEVADDEMIMFLQEALAYSMTARTDLKASFWLYGVPDSGKSTLLSLIRSLMGDLHSTIDLNTLGGNRFMLSAIIGRRAVTFSEADNGIMLPDGLYKAIVGGTDEIYADIKNKPGVHFTPEAKLWWAMNNAPRTSDRSGAVLNRLKPIIFNRSVPKTERIKDLDQILASELPGIFNWLIVGLRRLALNGRFTEPIQAERWLEEYRIENDTELAFVRDRCIADPEASTQSQTLYDTYNQWCIRNGFRAKNINQASKDWMRLGFEKYIKNGRMYWRGVRLTDEIPN